MSKGDAGTLEVQLRWAARAPSGTPATPKTVRASGAFSLVGERRYKDAPPRPRSLDLGPDGFLIVALDRTNRLKSFAVVRDPRIVRSEGPGEGGVLSGRTLYFEAIEFSVSVPDDPEIVELRLYEPGPSGAAIRFITAGSVRLSRRQ
jgi:hypothetical protein